MFWPINIYIQAAEWRYLAPPCFSVLPASRWWQIVCLSIYRRKKKKTPRCRGDLLPHACPRWLWISWCWELDSARAGSCLEMPALSQRAALTWTAERSSHISVPVLWRRDAREGVLSSQHYHGPAPGERRVGKMADNMITNTDHCFQIVFYAEFSPTEVMSFKHTNSIWIYSSCEKSAAVLRVEYVNSGTHRSDSRAKTSNSRLQLLYLMDNSFQFFLPSSHVVFIFVRSFRFKIGLMSKEPSDFLPCVRFFNMFVNLLFFWQDSLGVAVEVIQLLCFRCPILATLHIITAEIVTLF